MKLRGKKRMTINVLLETLLGKSCLLEGTFGDATPFTSNSTNIAEKLCDRLQSNGYERHGWEELISGFTGEPIKAKIFTGPTFYQRLKHMVKDKIHSRSSGDVTLLTRQPLEGRSRDGGKNFMPQWYIKILLVCVVTGNTFKVRGSFNIAGFRYTI